MILDSFPFFKICFFFQPKRPCGKVLVAQTQVFFFLWKKGIAVLPWPGGPWELAAKDSCCENVREQELASKGWILLPGCTLQRSWGYRFPLRVLPQLSSLWSPPASFRQRQPTLVVDLPVEISCAFRWFGISGWIHSVGYWILEDRFLGYVEDLFILAAIHV